MSAREGYAAHPLRLRKENLARLKVAPSNAVLSSFVGMGCYLDPPGYPSYALRSASWYKGGQEQDETVLRVDDKNYIIPYDTHEETLRSLYDHLPLEHPDVKEWVAEGHRHNKHCYQGTPELIEALGQKPSDNLVIFPIPDYKYVHVGLYVSRPSIEAGMYLFKIGFGAHLTKELRDKYGALHAEYHACKDTTKRGVLALRLTAMLNKLEGLALANVDGKKQRLADFAASVCTVDTHVAVQRIRHIYPDYVPAGGVEL